MLKMPPPIAITEDTPPDMLSGSMDLSVVLPNNKTVRLNVERSTPMLDLLVQVTTAHKMSPGSHYLQPYEENGLPLPYKPSTPIGTLDVVTIHVVPKTGGSIHAMISKRYNVKPFEKTFRLQVHLPHNQLYVMRTNGNTKLSDILHQICQTKNLDASKYSLRHPVNTDKILCLSQTIADTNLQQLSLVPHSAGPLGVSTVDIIGLKSSLDRCDESLSSGSLGGRSLSPTRSDASTESPPLASVMPPPRPGRKRRPAPKPPQLQSQTSVSSSNSDSHHYLISHSRNSSDSSGYHEASLLSESPESNSLPDSLPRRSKLTSHPNSTNLPAKFKMSQSCSNLNSTSSGLSLYKKSNISSSSVSLSSAAARKKKPAPLPPTSQAKMSALPEEKTQTLKTNKVTNFEIEEDLKQKSATLPSSFPSPLSIHSSDVVPAPECRSSIPFSKIPQPKPRTKLLSDSDIPKLKRRAPSPPKRIKLDSLSDETKDMDETAPRQIVEESKESSLACNTDSTAQENDIADFKLDEEIDRIFHNATKDYETPSLTYTDLHEEPESIQWEYKLPDPPTAFRDANNPSPSMTEFDTVTICNLTEIVSRDPVENNLVIHTEHSNGIFDHEKELPKPKKIPNKMIVSVTIENDYKKFKADDEGSDSKQNSMGNDSGLELDDVLSKQYENNNQNGTMDRFQLQNEFDQSSENIIQEINNNYKSSTHSNDSENVAGTIEKYDTDDSKQKNNKTLNKNPEKVMEQNSQVVRQKTKITNGFRSNLYHNETTSRTNGEETIPAKHTATRNETSNELKSNPLVSSVKRDHKEESHKDLKKDEDEKASQVTDSKSAVINELSSFINESKVGVREMANLINDKPSRTSTKPKSTGSSTSTLSNFKISTYENMKRPISIYCDDSVVNTKPKEINQVAPKPKIEKPKTNIPKINRHNSLSQYDRPDMTSAMKRSSSYISLLSNPVKFNLQKFDKFFSSSCENLEAASNLRRTSSELSINKDNNSIIKLRDARKEVPWKRSAQNMSELQSIQVLKSILPRLSVTEETSLEKENLTEQIPSQILDMKDIASQQISESSADIKEETIPEEPRKEEAGNKQKDVNRRYSYQGVPDVNFTTWNERPKVQVNLKTDRDYKTGGKMKAPASSFKSSVNNNFKNVTDVNGVESSTPVSNDVAKKERFPEKIESRNISMRLVSRTNSYKRPVSTDLSPHAPIVRAVELKKPLSYINGNVPTPSRVARPMSCYLFGENVDYYKTNGNLSTRDMLLESIRSFGKNSLKKLN